MLPDLPSSLAPREPGSRILVVAELSANHNGRLERALETIRAAGAAGADAVKFQTYTADTMTLDCRRDEFLIREAPWAGRNLYELYQEAHTPWEWHPRLREEAKCCGLHWFSTPFDGSAVDFLEELGAPAYKIASFELVDLELLERVARTGKPVIASTGMATREEIGEAVGVLRRVWSGREPGLVLLRCVSAYPAPPEEMNLAALADLARAFGALPGLSDHTLGSAVAVAAAALGARVIEKHLTLRRADGGPDSSFSLEPGEFAALVRDVRTAERAVGQVRYGPGASEHGSRLYRRSLFAVEDIPAGAPFTRQNVRAIRPGHGLPPRELPRVLARRAARALERGTPLSEELLA